MDFVIYFPVLSVLLTSLVIGTFVIGSPLSNSFANFFMTKW